MTRRAPWSRSHARTYAAWERFAAGDEHPEGVPLAIATGASANSRHSIGTGVIGGMLGATVIAVFFIPMFFYILETMSEKKGKGKPKPDPHDGAQLAGPPGPPLAGAGGPTIAASANVKDE